MTRSSVPYGEMVPAEGASFVGASPDTPEAGFYIMPMRTGGALCALRIWHGYPLDPVTGVELDRSPGWHFDLNGEYQPTDISRVWPKCADKKVTKAKYEKALRRISWAKEHLPDSALANPAKVSNPLQSPLQF